MSDVEAWLDADFLSERVRVSTLSHDRGTMRFSYDSAGLKHKLSHEPCMLTLHKKIDSWTPGQFV